MSDQNFQPYPPQGQGQPPDYGQYGQYPGGGNYPEPQQPGNGLAIAALVCGIIGLFVANIILGPLSIIFGGVGLSRANKGAKHKGLAIAGLVLGVVDIIVFIVVLIAVGNAFTVA